MWNTVNMQTQEVSKVPPFDGNTNNNSNNDNGLYFRLPSRVKQYAHACNGTKQHTTFVDHLPNDKLIYCVLMTPYGIIELGRYCRHHAIANVN